MKTKLWAIILVIICTLFTSSAQILFKMGANKSGPDPISFILNWQILLGIACYGIGAVLMIISLRGGEVTVLYPIITSSYIWVTISSSYFFGEAINPLRGFGIFLIIAGILMITFGEKDKKIIGYMEPV